MFQQYFRPTLLALGIAALVSGCATVPADRGLSDVSALTTARGGPSLKSPDEADAQAQTVVESLLDLQLSVQDALSIALVRNPRIRAEYSRLGIAGAEVLEAGRLSNPTLSASILFANAAGAGNQTAFGLAQSFTDLLLLRSRSRLAKGAFERAKAQAGASVLELARDVESAYFRLVGAQQAVAMRASVAKSAGASADLAQRFFDAGNITDLALSLEKAASAQVELSLLSAQAEAVEARSALNILMGLSASETRWSVSDRLPLPVAQEDELPALQDLARHQRLDLAAARQEVALRRDALDVTKTYRYIGNIDVGIGTESDPERNRVTGPTLALQLPIFNQNQGGVLRAQSSLELAEAELKALEIQASNAVALANARVLNARRAVELHREKLVPLRERVVQRTQERVNYMLVGVFDLIRAKQDEYDAYQSYLQSVRDYWSARTELALAVGAPLPSNTQISDETVEPQRPAAASANSGHMHHDMGGMQGTPGMEGMDHSGHDMGPDSSQPEANPHAGHDMKGMEGMDMKDMEGMSMPPPNKPKRNPK
ncbi:MAG: TolC family protein [Nevskiaceae bacterium]|nr:MAG: TolC family protein [Nevskiaceae bacterium]